MAGAAPGLDADQTAMWRALVAGSYFAISAMQCRSCWNPRKPCGRFFCAECRVGNVCHATFRDGGAHAQHAGIRVWKVSHQFSVRIDDVRLFMPRLIADQLQVYQQNHRHNVKFVKSDSKAKNIVSSRPRMCHGSCGDFISISKVPNHSARPVCSLKCLLDYLDARAGVAVPRPVLVRPDAVPRPELVVPVARPLLIADDDDVQVRVDDVQVRGGVLRGDDRRQRRKQNTESVGRAPFGA